MTFPSLQRWLQQQMQEALSPWQDERKRFPLTLRLQSRQINYRSAIALAWAGKETAIAPAWAQQLVIPLQKHLGSMAEVQMTPPAWIDITLTPKTLQQWLSSVLTSLPVHSPMECPPSSLSFPQYSHARCCQLLQLAVEQTFLGEDSDAFLIHALQQQESTHLSSLESTDWQLLYQLIFTLDYLESCCEQAEKLATALSNTFTQFHRHCRFLNPQLTPDELFILRVSLLAITQKTLQELLSLLGKNAPQIS